MKIGQFIRTKWQSFRAWQENPINYQKDKHWHVCHNCGHRFWRWIVCTVLSLAALLMIVILAVFVDKLSI